LSKNREYTYIEDNTLKLDVKKHFDFIENYQKSIFLSLVERNLLTPIQCEQCIEELERQRKEQPNE